MSLVVNYQTHQLSNASYALSVSEVLLIWDYHFVKILYCEQSKMFWSSTSENALVTCIRRAETLTNPVTIRCLHNDSPLHLLWHFKMTEKIQIRLKLSSLFKWGDNYLYLTNWLSLIDGDGDSDVDDGRGLYDPISSLIHFTCIGVAPLDCSYDLPLISNKTFMSMLLC